MEPGKYKIEDVEKETAFLKAIDGSNIQQTFPVAKFEHNITVGDVVEIWEEGARWRTKYLEEETKSASSHTKDFLNRIFEQE
ncbi:hypothetical protein [Planococcus salinus]|uniref:DUF3006 domain-containing protein n=1 Tax=Planococcus salinus TaxID=1848460 RepID=A0A3M8P4T0_9BACL|nr:hypothetical protein [Planococcus salinus]RNF38669.1 hypothetical protein EEX84_13730 [Planococcus salinus]